MKNEKRIGYTPRSSYDEKYFGEVICTEPLKSMPYASAKVLYTDDGTVLLRSYTTIVAAIDSNGYVYCFWNYSATTRKHLSAFARQYGFTYKVFKDLMDGRIDSFNIHAYNCD